MQTDTQHTVRSCNFDIKGSGNFRERRRLLSENGHSGSVFEMLSPDGINFGYYNLRSSQEGEIVFRNMEPFIQMSYTMSGSKRYSAQSLQTLASFEKHQYNYLFFPKEEIHLHWQGGEQLEIFELGISPELVMNFMPPEHPLFSIFTQSIAGNAPMAMSEVNFPLQTTISTILYDMLNCPLEGRYKQLFLKAKTIELLAIQLSQYEKIAGIKKGAAQHRSLKKEDVDRMHLARDIIVQNINSPCTLIDLAHQVGTNDAYLKNHFKQVFGTTVYGYLQGIKMAHARELLAQGKQVSEVAYLTGYKHTAHFTRAFKKHFGFSPGKMKQ